MNEKDEEMLATVQVFNPYDLYSKSDKWCDIENLHPNYRNLISKFFPKQVKW